ncbi:MAG: hypothetical protein OSA99_03650 [Acidimicrobiales bacterium]|nr:hypothetical protein [Acidimicrobiales bacterium]
MKAGQVLPVFARRGVSGAQRPRKRDETTIAVSGEKSVGRGELGWQ